ncbi:hypothetical protein [Phenylobacterium sp. J367]|uniref:hypothetical protein n=1 Tax=Phenylobacterium sp. J367 TaxID=2898435 RepID=UPI002151165B|nr:hypothetical protein [Phenylobacterium sp. J367]MCR5877870.1 hypothetical protein [Phenylobacterium sp. J367]
MRLRLLACLLVLSAASAATAQPRGGPPGATGGDGPELLPSRDEARGPPPPRIQLFISPSGEPFRGADGLSDWFASADGDRDGALTPAELRADAMRFFKVIDFNGDQVVDGFEVQRYEAEIAPEITLIALDGVRPERGRGGRGLSLGRQGAARFGLLSTPHPVRAGDLDVDGRVTEAEWARAAARRFELLDRAKAGSLTLAALRPAEKGRRPPPKG